MEFIKQYVMQHFQLLVILSQFQIISTRSTSLTFNISSTHEMKVKMIVLDILNAAFEGRVLKVKGV
jgi:hypothetical protein